MMEIRKLDSEKLGEILLRVPLGSMQAHHKKIQSTINDNFLPGDENLEGQFVRDLFTMDTQEIIDKWYGGSDAARELLLKMSK